MKRVGLIHTCWSTVTTARRCGLVNASAYRQSLVMSKYSDDSVILAKFERELMTTSAMSSKLSHDSEDTDLLENHTSCSFFARCPPVGTAHA